MFLLTVNIQGTSIATARNEHEALEWRSWEDGVLVLVVAFWEKTGEESSYAIHCFVPRYHKSTVPRR